MAHPLEHYAKLMIGDLVLTVSKLTAENDALKEEVRAGNDSMKALTAELAALKQVAPKRKA